jgi:hypothetical protein
MAATGPLVTPDELRAVLGPVTAEREELQKVCDAVDQSLLPLLTDQDHSLHENCREAGLTVAVQVWQARHAPGGQMIQADFGIQQSPHLLGPGLVSRVSGVLGPCLPYGGAVVA